MSDKLKQWVWVSYGLALLFLFFCQKITGFPDFDSWMVFFIFIVFLIPVIIGLVLFLVFTRKWRIFGYTIVSLNSVISVFIMFMIGSYLVKTHTHLTQRLTQSQCERIISDYVRSQSSNPESYVSVSFSNRSPVQSTDTLGHTFKDYMVTHEFQLRDNGNHLVKVNVWFQIHESDRRDKVSIFVGKSSDGMSGIGDEWWRKKFGNRGKCH